MSYIFGWHDFFLFYGPIPITAEVALYATFKYNVFLQVKIRSQELRPLLLMEKNVPRKTEPGKLAPIAAVMLWSAAEQHLSEKRDYQYLRDRPLCFK